MYQNGGFIASESGTISILAGSVFGGGTSINWSGSLKTQHYVREEWAKKKGLDWFLTKGYSDALDAVRNERRSLTESRSVIVWVFRPSISSKVNQMGSFWPEVDSLDIMPTLFRYVSCCRHADLLAKYQRIRT